jgi:pSer/pThr/pTyr-binding forkhead associated (FHA) protein
MSFVIQKVVGRQISLSEVRTDVLRIGRGTNAELRSDNPAVALEHAVIAGDSAGYTVTDKGSITGTYVNGKPVETARLAKGDVIEIGDLKVDVQVADPAKPLFLRIVTKAKRNVSQAAPIVEEEEAPVAAATPGGGATVRATRVDYAAAYRLHRTYLTKLSLIAFGLIIAFIAIAEVTKPEKQTAFMPGGLSSVHSRQLSEGQVIAKKCDACHDPWKSVKDDRCMACHKRKIHSDTEIGSPPCMKCHTEHRGEAILTEVSEATCATCHTDLPAHMKPEARASAKTSDPRYPFESLRKITAFGVDHPAIVPLADPNNLRFNHKLHLSKGRIRNASGKREVLECAGCHSMTVTDDKSDPVVLNFELHCQRCHLLTFYGRTNEQVPHIGDPNVVYGFVTSVMAGNRDILGKSPDQIRKILSRGGGTTPGASAYFAAEQVVKNKCGKCHELKKVGERWVAQPPVILTSWFPGTKFTHTPEQHRLAGCENCHKGVREASKTSAVLMPKLEDCTGCHGPTQAVRVSGCRTCHEYHVRSKALLASVTAAASAIKGTPPGSGENERMIDKILLIAIALLLVVVIVPIGIALYQRLKPRPDDRPAGGAPRPAPAPPPPLAPSAPPREAAPPPPAAPPTQPPRPATPAPIPESDRTRIGLPGEKPGGGKISGTEFVQWNGMLLCTGGPLEGQRFVIEEAGFYIGRDAQLSQVVVNDSRVSKRHVRILPRDGKVMAIDQSSTNGTFIGSATGQRITEVQLKRGDTIILADNAATFTYQI